MTQLNLNVKSLDQGGYMWCTVVRQLLSYSKFSEKTLKMVYGSKTDIQQIGNSSSEYLLYIICGMVQ